MTSERDDRIFRHKSKVKANGKSVKNHYFALQHEQEKVASPLTSASNNLRSTF